MTEEEIKTLQDAKEEAEKRASEADTAIAEAKAAADKAKSDLTNVVSELTDERKKKAEALEELKNINNPNPNPDTNTDVSSLIQAELAKRDQERVKTDVESAITEFKNSKTEFQTDSSGIVFDKFKKELSKFSFTDVSSKEQARQRLEEAYRFVRNQPAQEGGGPEYEGGNPNPATPPEGSSRTSPEVEKAIENSGITTEKFNKLSDKYGDALVGLGIGSQK